MSTEDTTRRRVEERQPTGWTVFAGVLLLIVGSLDALYGLAAILNERGIIRYEQIAKLSPGQVEALDESLGAFRGRLARDRIVDQADYLARGDREGFEARFGKL